MSKKLVYNYEFDASAQTITIGGNYSLRKLILITNVTDGVIIYNFADATSGGTVYYDTGTDKTTITLEYNTTAMSDSDELQILADDAGDTKIDAGESLIDPVHKFRVSNPQNLIDTDFEYGLQPTKWETIELVDNIPSVYARGSGVSIGNIREINTVVNTDTITVKTEIDHDLGIGDPIEVQGASSRTANGKYVVIATPTNTEFLYRASAVQSSTGNIRTAYTTVIPGSFFSGSDIQYIGEKGIETDNAQPSTLTIETEAKHGISTNTSVYIRNTVGKKEFTISNTSQTQTDGYTGVTTYTPEEKLHSFFLPNHNLYSGQRLTVYAVGAGATLPQTPTGYIAPKDDSTIQIIYDKTVEACDEINDDLEAVGRNGVIVQRNSGSAAMYAFSFATFTWAGSTHYQRFYYGPYYASYNYQQIMDSFNRIVYYRKIMNDPPSSLLTGKPVNLGSQFVQYSSNSGASTNNNLDNFFWYQATPFSDLTLSPYLIEIKQHAPSTVVDNSGAGNTYPKNRYYDYSYNNRGNQYWYGYPYGYNDTYYIQNTRQSLGDGWYYTYSVANWRYYYSNHLGYAKFNITLSSDTWAGYQNTNASKTFYLRNRAWALSHWDGAFHSDRWEIDVLIPYDQSYSIDQYSYSQTVFTFQQVVEKICNKVVAALVRPEWQNSSGINTVRAINLDNNRIQLRDGVGGAAFEFMDKGVGPLKFETDQVAGVADNYYAVSGVGNTTISIDAGTKILPRTLEFTDAGLPLSQSGVLTFENDYYITINGGHGMVEGQKVTYTKVSGTDIPGLTSGNNYWAIVDDDQTFRLADTYENSQGLINAITGAPGSTGSYKVEIFSINGRVSAPGLISIPENGTVVTGSDTRFTSTYKIGDNINIVSSGSTINEFTKRTIKSIVGDTTLALENPVGYAVTNQNHYVETTVNVRADGTFLHRPFDGGVEITAGKSPDSTIVRQTRKYFRYQSGKGIQISMAINYNPARPILSGTGSGSNITMTTEYPHGLTAGDTVKVSGAEEISTHTPSSATYNPVTGMFVFTQNGHGFEVGEEIFIEENSITLRCALNSYADDHLYPRSTDPAGNNNRLKIISKTTNTYTVDVGTSTNQSAHNVTAIAADAVSHVDISNAWNGTYYVTAATDFTFSYVSSTSVTQSAPQGYIEYAISGYKNAAIRAGLFDFQNGFFFEYDGKDIFCVRRSSVAQLAGTASVLHGSNIVTGTNMRFQDQIKVQDLIVIRGQTYKVVSIESQNEIHVQPSYRGTTNSGVVVTRTVDTRVKQANWNIDKADGTGPSGYVLDVNKIQMAYMDYSWYGAGKIRFGFKDTYGHVKYMHEFIHNNKLNEAYMRSGNVPARYEVLNKGIPTFVPSLFHWGTSVIMDGGFDDDDSYLFTASGKTLTFTNGDADTADTSGASSLYAQRVSWRYYNYYVRIPFASADASKFQTGVPLYTDDGALDGEAVAFTSYSGASFYVYVLISSGYSAPGAYPNVDSATTVNIGAPTVGASGVDLTSLIPLISVRLAPSADNNLIGELGERDIVNRMQLKMQELGISVSHDAKISVVLNGSLSNLAYDNVGTPSLSQYVSHDAGDTIEDGTVIYSFRASGGAEDANGRRLTASNAFDLSSLTDLGNSILGGDGVFPNGPDIVTICATVINTAQIDKTSAFQVASRVSWAESQA